MRARRTLVAAAALGALAACSSCSGIAASDGPEGWDRAGFRGGEVSVPPGWRADPDPPRPQSLLSRGLEVDGRIVARMRVYREVGPAPPEAPAPSGPDESSEVTDAGSDTRLRDIPPPRCPGTDARRSLQVDADEATAAVNVFDLPAGEVAVCASYSGDPGLSGLQVVLRGREEALPASVWRPMLASVRFD